MKHMITYLSLIGSLVVLCLVTNAFDIALMFMLFGIVPGQAEPLSADTMLALYGAFAFSIMASYLAKPSHSLLSSLTKHRQARA